MPFSGLESSTATPSQNTDFPVFSLLQTLQEPNEALAAPMMGNWEESPRIISNNDENGGRDSYWLMPQMNDIMIPSFPETFGVSNAAIPALPGLFDNVVGNVNGEATSFGFSSNSSEESCVPGAGNNMSGEGINHGATLHHLPPINYPRTYNQGRECWGAQSHSGTAAFITFDSTKVGRYSAEEKKDRILRYLKKRNHRNFNKTIKYACRKTLADRRARVRGRFAKNINVEEEEEEEEETETIKKNNDDEASVYAGEQVVPLHPYNNSINQMINNDETSDEDWLQEAMASLMYTNNVHFVPGAAACWHGGSAYS